MLSRSHLLCRLTTPATCHAPPRPLVGMVVALPLLMPPPSICRRLLLHQHLSCLSSVRLVVESPPFSRCHLPSTGPSASHRTIASCHAPLGPLVQLVKASPLLTPSPCICGIIKSSQWSGLNVDSTWRNRLGYPAQPGLILRSVCPTVRLYMPAD